MMEDMGALLGKDGEVFRELWLSLTFEKSTWNNGDTVDLMDMVQEPAFVDELLDRVWSGVTVNEESLSRAVHAARTALGDDGERQRIIQTVRRRGFRFVAELEASVDSAESPTFRTAAVPPQSDGVPFIGRESTPGPGAGVSS